MSMAARDGAWVSAAAVQRFECSKCGNYETSRRPMNDREVEQAILQHMRDKHGGSWRA